MLQQLMHAGRAHEARPACAEGQHPVHCWGCHRDGPKRARAWCGECWHAWRWAWLLSLSDARLSWRLGKPLGAWDVRLPWWRRIRVRRPSKIWVCPCCAHDL